MAVHAVARAAQSCRGGRDGSPIRPSIYILVWARNDSSDAPEVRPYLVAGIVFFKSTARFSALEKLFSFASAACSF